MKSRGLHFVLTLLSLGAAWGAEPLGPYLLRPADRPADCQTAPGFYPLTPKVAAFYDYKTYQVALPRVIERHAQSFACGPDQGTLYFFAYRQAAEAESAERFARNVLGRETPAPDIASFPGGFVVKSFRRMPPSLEAALARKLSPASAAPVNVSSRPVVTAPGAVALAVSTPVAAVKPAAPASTETLKVSPPKPAPRPAGTEEDLSAEVLEAIQKDLDCGDKELEIEVREACDLTKAFKLGMPFEPVVSSDTARLGVAYRINSFGQLNARYYDAAVGTGRTAEIALFPVTASNGVEDFELQALISRRRAGQPLAGANELSDRLLQHGRPGKPTLLATRGNSWVMPLAGGKKVYFRQAGHFWILVSVQGDVAAEQTRNEIGIAGLY